ncbi:unnamed protein product [Cuscuta europaea]|uniref:F-box domain-containing protein n=1 Tax=Cuscuta europaea TaxID=41803 RepID=A0A9P0ZVZ5_CUSEU|nr:unnamed protein product [Cuscuta europaea]
MDDQIVTRILVCLAPKSVFRFRVVSKSWNDLISDPFFIERYDSERRGGRFGLLAFFRTPTKTTKRTEKTKKTCMLKIIPLDISGYKKIEYQSGELERGTFINSSNGLILWGGPGPDEYHVLNPFTQRSVFLPPPPPPPPSAIRHPTVGLMCEENKRELAAKYVVIRAYYCGGFGRLAEKDDVRIVTYSSETGVWTASHPTVIAAPGVYVPCVFQGTALSVLAMKGVFHWYNYSGELTLALYRPDHGQVIEIRRYGGIENNGFVHTTMTRSSIDDGDVLWFGCIGSESMRVFMLPNGSEEWNLMYVISGGSLGIKTSLSTKGIILEAFLPIPNKAPVAVIRFQKRIFLYNMDTESLLSVPGRPLDCLQLMLNACSCYPYSEPSCLSTFAL